MEKSKGRLRRGTALVLSLSLLLPLVSGWGNPAAGKTATIKKLEIKNTDSNVLVLKKKEKAKLKIAINGKVSKKAWKQLKFHSKKKKIVSVSKKGVLKARKKGKTTVTITAKKSHKKIKLTVIVGKKVSSIQMTPSEQKLTVGESVKLSADILPKKASYKKIRWTSSDRNIATVTADGQVTAVHAGTADIRAASMDGTKKTGTCRIHVQTTPGSTGSSQIIPTGKPGSSQTTTDRPGTNTTMAPSGKPGTNTLVPSGKPDASSAPISSEKPGTTVQPGSSEKPDIDITPGANTSAPSGKPGTNTLAPSGKPGASAAPISSGNPGTTVQPGSSEKPDIDITPGANTSAPSKKPGADTTSAPSKKPDADITSAPSKKPDADVTSAPSKKPDADVTSAPSKKPDADTTPASSGKPGTDIPSAPTDDSGADNTPIPTKVPGATGTTGTESAPTSHSSPRPSQTPVTLLTQACNAMTCGGSHAGTISKPFDGVALYGNGDKCSMNYTFEGTNKKYRMIVKGASSNNTAASVSVYIGDVKKGSVSFTGTELQEQSFDFKMQEAETGELSISFLLENDNGSNDTYLNSFELICLGDIPEPPAAPVPRGGAAYTGSYRNMFKEAGYPEAEIDEKVEQAWQKLFYGTEDERIYYPVDDDMAYIYTADTQDVRSEGMSYGMMICVQMNKQAEFDRLWKWAKTYMQHTSGEFKDFFAWKCISSGAKQENTPASDGEEYFATALLFASARWGDGDGIYNYNEQAQIILKAMLHQSDDEQGVNMFNSTHKMPVFCPIGNAASFTDPSYHLPAFYEVWAQLAEQDNDFWSEAADASRAYFQKATDATTGLGPDYSEYDGSPHNGDGNHAEFRFDAWRIAANIACDYAWWGKNTWATTHANTIQAFFTKEGVSDYGNQYELNGKKLDSDHSPGLVAMNATASLAASERQTWAFLDDLWNISPTTGKYRYYDGCLYMMGLLHCSGRFRVYLPDGSKPAASATISADTYEFDKNEANNQQPIKVTMTLQDNTLTEIRNGSTVLTPDTDYTLAGNVVTIKSSYLAAMKTGNISLTFVFSAGRNATLTLTIKDTTPGAVPDISSPFEEIPATAFSASEDVDVDEESGIVTFNSTSSYISFDLEFDQSVTNNSGKILMYVKEPNNGGKMNVTVGQNSYTIYNLGNGSWKEVSEACYPTINAGKHTVKVQATNAGTQIQWIKFTKSS